MSENEEILRDWIEKADHDLRNFSAQTKGLDFWEDSKEDIYQDYLIPKAKAK
jgi:hypothetical protein